MESTSAFDPEIEQILKELLETDVTITAREVARRHPKLNHASSITRKRDRMERLRAFKAEQDARRQWQARTQKRSGQQVAAQLAKKDMRIAELERQVEALCISHLAMIRTVGEMGGISKLLRLYEGYRDVRSQLAQLGVLPENELKQIVHTPRTQDRISKN